MLNRILSIGVLASSFAVPAASQPVPVSPQVWDRAALDHLFDGGALGRAVPFGQASSSPERDAPPFIIRPEDGQTGPAPRYALDLQGVPPQFRRTVAGFEQLFHRNQEETQAWTERTNAIIRERNKGRLFKIPEWTYDGRTNEPPFTCLAFAAGTVNDWWALQLGRSLPSYENANNGAVETGLDPRLLELKYIERANAGAGSHYFLLPKFIEKDPVRNIASPQQPLGYADILLEGKPYEVEDPFTGKKYGWDPGMSAMEGQYKELFSGSIFQSRTPDKYAKVLAQGIERWGIAYVQVEHTQHPRLSGAHTVAVVGYFCMGQGQQLQSCSANQDDKAWGENTYFIIHDSFGDFPADKQRDASGGSAYRAVRIESIDQAVVFPHSLLVTARPASAGLWELSVANKGGKPVELISLHARRQDQTPVLVAPGADGKILLSGRPGDEVLLDVEARYYYEPDGKARTFKLKLSAEPAAARELIRSAPTQVAGDPVSENTAAAASN